MSTRDGTWIAIGDLTGGLNTADPPMTLLANQLVEAQNVEFYRSSCGRKRAGTANVTTASGPSASILSLMRHVPSTDDTTAELWAADSAVTADLYRLTAGTTWVTVALPVGLPGVVTGNLPYIYGVSFNGKLFLVFPHSGQRLLLFDGTSIRFVGFLPAGVPTVADTGAGTYPAILRYYKTQQVQLDGTTIVRASELPTGNTAFTPSGTGTAARLTKPVLEAGATHWVPFGSADNQSYFALSAPILAATTTFDDTVLPATYQILGFGDAPLVGEFTAPPNAKFLLVDEDRLLMAGNWGDAAQSSIVEFTTVGGDKDQGDDERVPKTSQRKYFLNLDRRHGGEITGFGGPIYSSPYVFKFSRVYQLVRTGNVTAPYSPRAVSKTKGAISQRGIALGEDELGQETLYFFDQSGPYRVGVNGVQWLGRDNIPIWARVNLAATTPVIALYYGDRKQVWWYVALDAATTPSHLYVLDVTKTRLTEEGVRGGWAQHTLPAAITSAVMFANTIGATMSRDLKPYLGMASGVLRKANTGLDDAGTDFQGIVTTKPFPLVGSESGGLAIGVKGGVTGVVIEAEASLSTVDIALHRDYGIEQRPPKTISLVPVGLETRVIRQVTDLELTEAQLVQVKFGDASALESTWNVDRIGLKLRRESDSL